MTQRDVYLNFKRDLLLILISLVYTVLFLQLGVFEQLFLMVQDFLYLGSFIIGFFFTSIFTIAPSSVALAELSLHGSPHLVALSGALGAMCGDLVLFFFVRSIFGPDLAAVLRQNKISFSHYFRLGFMRWFAPLLGAFIIASPLPDELGLTLLGFSKVRLKLLIPILFVFNYIGILFVSMVAKSL